MTTSAPEKSVFANVPLLTYFVDPGTFLSENVVLSLNHKLSLKSEGNDSRITLMYMRLMPGFQTSLRPSPRLKCMFELHV